MAKPLSEKSRIIRKAITANPEKGNTALAEMLNDSQDRLDDKITFTANDVAAQRLALKRLQEGANGPAPSPAPAKPEGKKRGRPAKSKPEPGVALEVQAAPAARKAPAKANPADLIDRLFKLADECGGIGQLKRLVDRVAEYPRV